MSKWRYWRCCLSPNTSCFWKRLLLGKIHEVSNHNFVSTTRSFCNEVAQREASGMWTFLPCISNLSQSWWPNTLTESRLQIPFSNETAWYLHLSEQKPKNREVFPLPTLAVIWKDYQCPISSSQCWQSFLTAVYSIFHTKWWLSNLQ